MKKITKNKKMRSLIKSHDKLVDPMLKMKLEVFNEVKAKLVPHAEEYTAQSINNFVSSLALHLRDDLGFGAKRIARSLERVMYRVDFLRDGTITADEVFETIKQETGFDFDKMIQEKTEGL